MAIDSNFLLIMADEFARQMMGCVGHPVVKTPNLDRLAARGVRFTQAYTNSPICVPARASLHTGRYVHDIRCWDSAQPYRGQHDSWAHALRRQGADAVSAGKLHFRRTTDDNGFTPEMRALHVKDGIGWAPALLRNPVGDFPAASELARDVGAMETAYHAYDREVTDEAIRWLETRALSDDRPWAMFVSLVSPHFPLAAPPAWYDLYAGADIKLPLPYEGNWQDHPALSATLQFFDYDRYFDDQNREAAIRGYFGLISFVDDQIGRLLNALDATDFTHDTTILFLSDHGEMLGDYGIWTKQVMFEGSVGIPLILSGPDIDKDRTVETPVSLVDVYPTILDAMDAQPDDAIRPGTSLLQVSAADEQPDRTVFSEYHDGGSLTGAFMVRQGGWKLVQHEGYEPQLFNLKDDPMEQRDQAADPAYREMLQAMQGILHSIVDPAAANALALSDQKIRLEKLGGEEKVRQEAAYSFGYSPPG